MEACDAFDSAAVGGIATLEGGVVPVRVEGMRGELAGDSGAGRWMWEKADAWRLELHEEFDAAAAETKLPERPDYEKVNAFLVKRGGRWWMG